MKKFCIITNEYKDVDNKVSKYVKSYLEEHGCTCVMFDSYCTETKEYIPLKENHVPDDTECVITVGGDGTLLRVTAPLKKRDVVFVGINMGHLGFLAEISADDITECLECLVNDKFNVESRMMLNAKLIRDGAVLKDTDILNDIIVHRGAEISISHYEVYINGSYLGEYNADGIVVCTPTGSTAYNMSAGGPFARPDSHIIILTPVCSHALGSRSIIFSKNDTIEIKIGEDRKNDEEKRSLSLDGSKKIDVGSGDIIRIQMAETSTKIIKFGDESFLQTIREKIK